MSASDYISIKRIKNTNGNRPFLTQEKYTEQRKVKNIVCIFNNNNSSTSSEILNYFDIVYNTSNDKTIMCMGEDTTITRNTHTPIIQKPRIIQIPFYCKNKTIIKTPCSTLANNYNNAMALRVCGTSTNTITTYDFC